MDLERPVFARRFVQLRARCKQKGNRDKKKIPFKIRVAKTLGKRDTRGKDPKVPVRPETHTSGHATNFQKEQCQKEPACRQDKFSARPLQKKIGWPPTKKQFRVRYLRNAVSHFRTRERKGPSLDIIQRGGKNDCSPNAPTKIGFASTVGSAL